MLVNYKPRANNPYMQNLMSERMFMRRPFRVGERTITAKKNCALVEWEAQSWAGDPIYKLGEGKFLQS